MTPLDQPPESEPVSDEEFGELDVAEYLVFLLALDTYIRYLEEHHGVGAEDDLSRRGTQLVRMADRRHMEVIRGFLDSNLPSVNHKRMLGRAFANVPTHAGLGTRTLKLRMLMSRGGASTMRAVFKSNKALKEIRDAMAAAAIDDADAALDKFAVIPMRNQRLRKWIDQSAETAGSGAFQNPTAAVGAVVSDGLPKLYAVRADQNAASPSSEASKQAGDTSSEILTNVQESTTQTAQRAMQVSGEPDVPPNRSEVMGIAAAAVASALSDPEIPGNAPASLKSLDPEQRAAALTDGRVLVAAGAGSGKSTTLVSRIDYLVKERGTNPGRILACSFNKKAADELKGKIAKKLGSDDAAANSAVQVGTMHSLFYKFIVGDKTTKGFGTLEEQAMLKPPRLVAPSKKGVKSVSPTALSTAIRSMWAGCDTEAMAKRYGFPEEWLQEPPKAKKAGLLLNKWRGNDIGLEEAKASVTSKAEAQAYVWYEMYTGLKGDIPGWVPPCMSPAYQNFMKRHRPGNERLGDLDDMLKVFLSILRRDSNARKTVQSMFDHFLVDECVHEDTEVQTPSGKSLVKDLKVGELVLGYENGGASFNRVLAKRTAERTGGVIVRTASGRELSMTSAHRIYATPFSDDMIPEGCLALYIMYRADKGFRIGVSSVPTDGRSRAEHADRLWVLGVGAAKEMLFKEQQLSLTYGVPTYVFEAAVRGCDQERVDQIFAEFGRNGSKLLETHGLSFHYPHWVSTSYSGTNRRMVMHLMAHRDRSSFSFSWTGERNLVQGLPVYEIADGRWMASFTSPTYSKVRERAVAVASQTGAVLWESVRHNEQTLHLTQAKALYKGMRLLVHTSGERLDSNKLLRGKEIRAIGVALGFDIPARGSVSFSTYQKIRQAQIALGQEPLPLPDTSEFELDEIVEISNGSGRYIDLEVESSSNFFGNGVLSHNCQDLNLVQHQIFELMTEHIGDGSDGKSLWMVGDPKQAIYQFRGGRPELFTSLDGKDGWKTRMIKTNYRCEPEIVEIANRLIAHNDETLVLEARANPTKQPGKASIVLDTPSDNTEAAINTISRVAKDMATEDAKAEDYAVLARTNAELDDFETACIINEIPYIRRGGKGFLEAPESKAVLGYIDLVNGSDYQKMRDSLVAVLMKPDRGLFLGADDVAKAVGEALDDVARRERVDVRSVNPAMLLESRYVKDLADRLKQPYRLKIVNSARDAKTGEFIYKKRVQELENNLHGLKDNLSDLRRFIEEGKQDTAGLLNYILDEMKSEVSGWDSAAKRATNTVMSLREQITHDTSIFSDGDDDEDEDDDDEPKPEVSEDGSLSPSKKKQESDVEEARGLGAVRFLYQLAIPNDNDQKHNTDPSSAQGFVEKIARYAKLSETLRIDPDKWEKDQAKVGTHKKPPAITLATIHSCKGLEWSNVSVLMPKGKFPPERKPKEDEPPPDPLEEAEKLKAERNLAYVALTRAAVNLEVICPDASGGKPAGISPFVFEAGLVPGENVPKSGAVPIESGPSSRTAAEIPDPYVNETLAMFSGTYDWRTGK